LPADILRHFSPASSVSPLGFLRRRHFALLLSQPRRFRYFRQDAADAIIFHAITAARLIAADAELSRLIFRFHVIFAFAISFSLMFLLRRLMPLIRHYCRRLMPPSHCNS
jgi:hypothetical protein